MIININNRHGQYLERVRGLINTKQRVPPNARRLESGHYARLINHTDIHAAMLGTNPTVWADPPAEQQKTLSLPPALNSSWNDVHESVIARHWRHFASLVSDRRESLALRSGLLVPSCLNLPNVTYKRAVCPISRIPRFFSLLLLVSCCAIR